MSHAVNGVCNELLEIGSMLGVEEKDILNLKSQALNQKNLLLQGPTDDYKVSTGYYGTLSINDF